MSDARNEKFRDDAESSVEVREPHPPVPASGTRFAMLTCMDARIDPIKLVGLRGGSDAHVIRNAGGRATDEAIRSLVLSHRLLGTREWLVVQHSHCGMALLTEEIMRNLMLDGTKAASRHGDARGDVWANPAHAFKDGRVIGRLSIHDQEQSVAADVARIRNHPLVPREVEIHGFIYKVETDRFVEVKALIGVGGASGWRAIPRPARAAG